MGESKLTIDQQNKIVRAEWIGKFELKEWEESCEKCIAELEKCQEGELSALGILTEMDMRLITLETAKSVGEFIKFLVSHTRKTASVMPSFMLQKSMEKATDTEVSNYRMFVTEQEAINWLLEK
ncbi:MAG TPA: STAS/SEC14 domain-containing protein [Patescibacteria group bacterium]|nr:STAS/SEC14 domain-containing protein [Patescibacteria group bacterium]